MGSESYFGDKETPQDSMSAHQSYYQRGVSKAWGTSGKSLAAYHYGAWLTTGALQR